MKRNIFIIKKVNIKLIIIFLFFLILMSIILLINNVCLSDIYTEKMIDISNNEEIYERINKLQNDIMVSSNVNLKYNKPIEKEKILPEKYKECIVIGKIEIPKIKLNTYILGETNNRTLNISVTKLCGPHINEKGNLCLTGHNYNKKNMFGNLKKLEINDKIKIMDMYGDTISYKVYKIGTVKPNELECLSQETQEEREVTLITCTNGAIKRLLVKCIEEYDE